MSLEKKISKALSAHKRSKKPAKTARGEHHASKPGSSYVMPFSYQEPIYTPPGHKERLAGYADGIAAWNLNLDGPRSDDYNYMLGYREAIENMKDREREREAEGEY